MLLVLSKIISTLLTVLLLTYIAKKISPRYAGVLGGFPLGSGLALYFFAWQHGEEFASASALAALAGLSSSILFIYIYWQLLIRRPKIRYIPINTLIAFIVFMLGGIALI